MGERGRAAFSVGSVLIYMLEDERLLRAEVGAFAARYALAAVYHGRAEIGLRQRADGTYLYRRAFVVLRAVFFFKRQYPVHYFLLSGGAIVVFAE